MARCLVVIGDLVEDVVVRTQGDHRRGTDNPSTIVRSRGGSAANVAVCAADLVPTRFIGRVGADATGDRLVASLGARGVEVVVQRGGRTGTVVVIVDPTAERTMFNDRATAAELAPIDQSWLDEVAVLHVPAYGLATEPMRSTVRSAARTARSTGALVSVDVSAVTVVEAIGVAAFGALLDEMEPGVVLANREEAEVLDLLDVPPPPGRLHVVKDGARPAVVVSADGGRVEVPVPPVEVVVDTTGAGDAFAAGYLAAVIDGAGPPDACRAGHRRAATVLAVSGADPEVTRPG